MFEAIRQARPSRLFLIADGPRNDEERVLCEQARAIVEGVDWPCEVMKNYAESNLGLRRRLASGLSWVFEQAEEAIILEDDCLPHPTFFRFCAELLERYRDEPRVMHIGGNYYVRRPSSMESFYFTRFPHVWGWATWRRAWQYYDEPLDHWTDPKVRSKFLRAIPTHAERRFWTGTLDAVQQGHINTWDYQWTFSVILNDGLCINPTRNLVRNLGFGADASHTLNKDDPLAQLVAQEMTFPLIAPKEMKSDAKADRQVVHLHFSITPSWKVRVVRIAVAVIGRTNYTRLRRLFR